QIDVVFEPEGSTRRGLREDLVQEVTPVGTDVELELLALEPRPGDDAIAVLPESELPLVLAAFVLVQTPGDVADVPRRARAEQPALLDRQLLHPCDDLRGESHV